MKKLLSIVLMCLFFCSVAIVSVEAKGNVSDTAFTFQFRDYQPFTGWLTEYRAKLDDTSSYMKCTDASGKSYTAWVQASDPVNNPYYGTDVGSKKYTFLSGSERWMVNYVYENGYRYARIEGQPNYSGTYKVTGVWSPDSV